MRTRKYRAYHDKLGWASPVDISYGNCRMSIHYLDEDGNIIARFSDKIKELHIMDYIGLSDNEGKDVYEEDILETRSEIVNFSTGKKTGKIKVTVDVVIFQDGMYRESKSHSGLKQYGDGLKYKTVIGNKYDNPGLLKGSQYKQKNPEV